MFDVALGMGLGLGRCLGGLDVNVVTNGGFESALTGWTQTGTATFTTPASAIGTGNMANITGIDGTSSTLTQTIPVVTGATYRVTYTVRANAVGTGNVSVTLSAFTGANTTLAAPATQSVNADFIATGPSLTITLGINGVTAAANGDFDGISVRRII